MLLSRLPEDSDHLLEYDNGVPVFAMMFYLIRTGHWQEALHGGEGERQMCPNDDTDHLVRGQQLPITSCATGRKLQSEYAQRQLTESDPFRMTLLKLLGRCDVKRKSGHPLVIQTAEDYLWLQLWLISGSGKKDGSGEDVHATPLTVRTYGLTESAETDRAIWAKALFRPTNLLSGTAPDSPVRTGNCILVCVRTGGCDSLRHCIALRC